MLRGPQTPGELKTRTERLHGFGDMSDLTETIERLIARDLAVRLDRRPGQREERYQAPARGGGRGARSVRGREGRSARAGTGSRRGGVAGRRADAAHRAAARGAALGDPGAAGGARRLKRSVSLVIEDGDRVLLVRRPDDDADLPGVWGLPAASLAKGESQEDAVRRAGREKLGVEVRPLEPLGQDGSMTDFRAEIVTGEPAVPQPGPEHAIRRAPLGRARRPAARRPAGLALLAGAAAGARVEWRAVASRGGGVSPRPGFSPGGRGGRIRSRRAGARTPTSRRRRSTGWPTARSRACASAARPRTTAWPRGWWRWDAGERRPAGWSCSRSRWALRLLEDDASRQPHRALRGAHRGRPLAGRPPRRLGVDLGGPLGARRRRRGGPGREPGRDAPARASRGVAARAGAT